VRAAAVCALLFAHSFLPIERSHAGLFVLVDDNSVVNLDTDSSANALNWIVDGVDHLFQQTFYYRIGNVAEAPVSTVPHPIEGTTDTDFDGNQDTLVVKYNGAGFLMEIGYRLDGGLPGSGVSDITEQISISNVGTSALDFHFFQYSDFEMLGTPGNDSVVFTNENAVRQFEGALGLIETVNTPPASHREADFFDNTRDKLEDGVASVLSDLPPEDVVIGPGDVTWAYQWDVVIPVGRSFIISKDKRLSFVPEPGPFALLSIGVGLLILARRVRLIA
jgi:hypothetical protein